MSRRVHLRFFVGSGRSTEVTAKSSMAGITTSYITRLKRDEPGGAAPTQEADFHIGGLAVSEAVWLRKGQRTRADSCFCWTRHLQRLENTPPDRASEAPSWSCPR